MCIQSPSLGFFTYGGEEQGWDKKLQNYFWTENNKNWTSVFVRNHDTGDGKLCQTNFF